MKFFYLLLFFTLGSLYSYAQKTDGFITVEKRISNTFFKMPEKAKKDAYHLKSIAKSNQEKQTAYKYLSYIYMI